MSPWPFCVQFSGRWRSAPLPIRACRRRRGRPFGAVDGKMDKAADKVADVATAKDPAREVGKMLGSFLSGEQRPKR